MIYLPFNQIKRTNFAIEIKTQHKYNTILEDYRLFRTIT